MRGSPIGDAFRFIGSEALVFWNPKQETSPERSGKPTAAQSHQTSAKVVLHTFGLHIPCRHHTREKGKEKMISKKRGWRSNTCARSWIHHLVGKKKCNLWYEARSDNLRYSEIGSSIEVVEGFPPDNQGASVFMEGSRLTTVAGR